MPLFVMFRSGVLATSILLLLLVCVPGCNGDGDAHNEELIVQMKEATDKIIETTHVPGIVALVADHARRINWVYAAGVSDIPNNIPANPSYTFRIGSNTKTLVVTVLLQLVAEGKSHWTTSSPSSSPNFPMPTGSLWRCCAT
jgi:CubicO group peptidase (beta-lactamase class C family)